MLQPIWHPWPTFCLLPRGSLDAVEASTGNLWPTDWQRAWTSIQMPCLMSLTARISLLAPLSRIVQALGSLQSVTKVKYSSPIFFTSNRPAPVPTSSSRNSSVLLAMRAPQALRDRGNNVEGWRKIHHKNSSEKQITGEKVALLFNSRLTWQCDCCLFYGRDGLQWCWLSSDSAEQGLRWKRYFGGINHITWKC